MVILCSYGKDGKNRFILIMIFLTERSVEIMKEIIIAQIAVKAMLRDQTERTMDMEILDKVPMEDLDQHAIHGYRNSHRTLKEGHPFERLNDHEYLRSIGAAAFSRVFFRL